MLMLKSCIGEHIRHVGTRVMPWLRKFEWMQVRKISHADNWLFKRELLGEGPAHESSCRCYSHASRQRAAWNQRVDVLPRGCGCLCNYGSPQIPRCGKTTRDGTVAVFSRCLEASASAVVGWSPSKKKPLQMFQVCVKYASINKSVGIRFLFQVQGPKKLGDVVRASGDGQPMYIA